MAEVSAEVVELGGLDVEDGIVDVGSAVLETLNSASTSVGLVGLS